MNRILLIAMLFSSRLTLAAIGEPDTLPSHAGAALGNVIASDSCYLCHWQTGPEMAYQTNQLCFQCHTDVVEKEHKSRRHIAVVSEKYPGLSCEGCHKIHKAGGRPLLRESELTLCSSCHESDRQNKSHPVIEYTDKYGARRQVIGSDGRLVTCASHCHDVHGSDHNYLCRLEPGRELCISCHGEFK